MAYKLDRKSFLMSGHGVNEPAIAYWKTKTPAERLTAAFYLNSVAYNFDMNNPPKLNREAFSMGKHGR